MTQMQSKRQRLAEMLDDAYDREWYRELDLAKKQNDPLEWERATFLTTVHPNLFDALDPFEVTAVMLGALGLHVRNHISIGKTLAPQVLERCNQFIAECIAKDERVPEEINTLRNALLYYCPKWLKGTELRSEARTQKKGAA